MKIKLNRTETIETDNYTIEQLRNLLGQIIEKCDSISARQRDAQVKQVTTGEYSDPDWYNRMLYARKKLNNTRQALQTEIGRRAKLERMKESAQSSVPKYFVKAAQDMLAPSVFDAVMKEALLRYGNTQKGWEDFASYVFEIGE